MKPELLSPAGSPEALRAAVQNGADAVYLGWGDFNARRSAKNFSDEEFADALRYCHLRGVRVFLTLNTLLTDRELPRAVEIAAQACRPEALDNGLAFAKGFAMTAYRLMTEPEHLEKIREEFNREVAGKIVAW